MNESRMLCTCPRMTIDEPRRKICLGFVDDAIDLSRHAAQVAAIGRRIHVEDRLHVVVVHDGGRGAPARRREVAEQLWNLLSRRRDRRVLDGVDASHLVHRRHHVHGVLHAVAWIDPEIWRCLSARRERDEYIARDVTLRKTKLLCLCAVDIEAQLRRVDDLLHVNVGRTRNMRDLFREPTSHRVVRVDRVTDDLHVDRRRKSQVQHLVHHVGRLEEERHPRILLWQFATKGART